MGALTAPGGRPGPSRILGRGGCGGLPGLVPRPRLALGVTPRWAKMCRPAGRTNRSPRPGSSPGGSPGCLIDRGPDRPRAGRTSDTRRRDDAAAAYGPDRPVGFGDLPGDDDLRRPVRRGDVLPDHGHGGRAGRHVPRHGRRLSDPARSSRRPGGPKRSSAAGSPRAGDRDVRSSWRPSAALRVGPGPNDQGLSRRHILEACEASLRRLRTDYIDLYQSHILDPETPLDETLRAFDDLVRSGMVRYIGCSNYAAWQLALALGVSERARLARYDCVQPRYNLLLPRDRGRAAAALPRPGGRRDRVQPARGRIPDRQARAPTQPPRRGRASPWACPASCTASATGTPRSSRPWRP